MQTELRTAIAMMMLASVTAHAQLANGSFETVLPVPIDRPTSFGRWQGNGSTMVTAQNGITPKDGGRMLQFIYTYDRPGPSTGCDVWSLVDCAAYAPLIRCGFVTVSASAYFNRIAGDAQTDTEFAVYLWAFEGQPTTFPQQSANGTFLASARTPLLADSAPSTWERASVSLALPTNTTFFSVAVQAVENISNDTAGTEFDGHYADDVTIMFTGSLPRLGIARSGTNVVVSWPISATNFVLEATGALSHTSVWSTVTTTQTVAGAERSITETASESARFYRLRK